MCGFPGRRKLDQLELSSLFHLKRERYSSAKALLRAPNAHLLPPESASAAEAATPG